MKTHDVVIIGAGIVGLASAYQLLRRRPGLRVAVVEKEAGIAQHQTGHNSGVIHSGIYYKPGSLKAENCRRGYHDLLGFCREHGIQHDVCGKVIVATREEERPLLHRIFERGVANGLEGIRKISAAETLEIEPHVRCVEAIWVPQTGIIDYAEVAEKYAGEIARAGGEILLQSKVEAMAIRGAETVVTAGKHELSTSLVVNCAGLYADKIARMTMPEVNVLMLPFRGEYYKLIPDKHYLVRNLIYPVPNPNFPFLGVHFTRMIRGGIEAGPNAVLAFRREGYRRTDIHWGELAETLRFSGFRQIIVKYWREGLDEQYRSFSRRAFAKALQHLVPAIREEDLVSGGAGVRAQACDPQGNLIDDFLIYESERVINVCNAPSPAATASLAIGDTIAQKIERHL
jgi:L-2-hydroxyglutarate oxidase